MTTCKNYGSQFVSNKGVYGIEKLLFKFFYLIVFLSVFIGCVGPYSIYGYKTNIQRIAYIGDIMMAWEYGTRNVYNHLIISATRNDIILTGIDGTIIKLQCHQYGKRDDFGPMPQMQKTIAHDMAYGNIIDIMGARIEIIDLRKDSVVYQVVSGPKT